MSADARLHDGTPTLSLLATAGKDGEWNDRARSRHHLAIPLLDKEFALGAPMIAKLLGDLHVDLERLAGGGNVITTPMAGTVGSKFYVQDAALSTDHLGRFIIPNREFVRSNDIHTVFGMGGPYFDGVIPVAIVFTNEHIDRMVTDRFASLISTFRIKTTRVEQRGKIYAAAASL